MSDDDNIKAAPTKALTRALTKALTIPTIAQLSTGGAKRITSRRKLEARIKVPGLIVKGLTEAGAVQSEVERDAILGKGHVVQIEQEGHE